jgi:soluble lytic murein transglycosylase-like protein
MLAESLRPSFDVVQSKWGAKCDAAADKYSLPHGWLDSMVYRESGGNEHAYRIERDRMGQPIVSAGRALTGIGLMQITSPQLKGRHTDLELFDPDLNLDLGARYLAWLAPKYDWDFPRIAAAFNAGSVRPSRDNRWGMVQTKGHVDSEVAALNYYLSKRLNEADRAAAMAVAVQFDLTDTLESGHVNLPDDDEA